MFSEIKSKIVTKGMRNLCDDNNKLVRISACIKFVQNMNRGGTKFSLIVPLKDKLSCDKVHVGGAKNNPSVKMFKCPETVVSFSADRVTVEEPFMIGQSKTPNERTVRAFRTAARSGTYDLATVVGQLKNFEFGVLGMEKTTGENTFTMTYTYDLANPRSNDDDDAGASSPSSPSNYPGSTKYIKLN